ncbi:MAG: CHAP domain-containing protein [Oscillospiraceae bacterium]|nr:CHAP domain-containing protein [Oscillospiraceae bacterium]
MTAERMVAAAKGEVGYLEKASAAFLGDKTKNAGRANHTKYGAWYGIDPGAWCAMFVSWCADRAGAGGVVPKHASCTAGIAAFRKLGRWHERKGFVPKPGDIVYFGTDGKAQHVGIVTGFDGRRVFTVEGNTSGGHTLIANGGCVAEKSYDRDYARILGYGRPDYEGVDRVTYEEFVGFLKRYEREKAMEQPAPWSAEARAWAEKNGLIRGDGEGMRYRSPLTREEYVVMAYRQTEGRA